MKELKTADLVGIVDRMARVIIANEIPFCELDSAAGDGDFGMSVAKGFKVLMKEWESLARDDAGAFLKDCSLIITEHCGGASGPIWGSAFRSAGKYAAGKESLSLAEFAGLLASAVEGIQKRGGAKLGDKTLLDALIPTAESLAKSAEAGHEFEKAFDLGAAAAREGAEKTRTYAAAKGRASYLGDRSLNYPDAGAMALGIIFTDIAEAFAAGEIR